MGVITVSTRQLGWPFGSTPSTWATQVFSTVPDPAVRGAARAANGTVALAEPVVVAKAPPADPVAPAVRPAGVVVSDRQPETPAVAPAVAPPVSSGSGTALLGDDGGSADYLLLSVGGGILLVLVVLLLARRK